MRSRGLRGPTVLLLALGACERDSDTSQRASSGTTGGHPTGDGVCAMICVAPDEPKCASNTCVDGACALSAEPSGTPLSAQTPGDCLVRVCDGDGGVESRDDDGDADDANECTLDTCAAGTALHAPVAAGTPCGGPSAAKTCDGNGGCQSCATCGWMRGFAGSGDKAAYAAATDQDGNVFVTGGFEGGVDFGGGLLSAVGELDMFLVKLDGLGNHLWSASFASGTRGTGNLLAYALAVDAAGDVLVTGAYEGAVDFGGGPLTTGVDRVFVVAFDPNGEHSWSKSFGPGGEARSIAIDGSGDVLLGGTFLDLDLGGGPLATGGSWSAFVAKLDATGGHVWSKSLGGSSASVTTLASDLDGNVLLGGLFDGDLDLGGGAITAVDYYDGFFGKLDPNGNHVWSKHMEGPMDQQVGSIDSNAAGNVIVGGAFMGSIDVGTGPLVSEGIEDGLVLALDADGNALWSRRIGGDGAQRVLRATADAAGNVVFTGTAYSAVDFGEGPAPASNQGSVFVAKLDPTGSYLWPDQRLRRVADPLGRGDRPVWERVRRGWARGNDRPRPRPARERVELRVGRVGGPVSALSAACRRGRKTESASFSCRRRP